MGWLREVRTRLGSLLARRREEAELDEEVHFHLEMETEKLLRAGWEPKAARREAHRRFGGVERMKERTREERGTGWVDDGLRDLRYAARTLRRSPGFALVAVLTLALGIGATTAMFSLVRGVLLRPLPYPEPERLVTVWERTAEGGTLQASYMNFADWRAGASSLEALAAYTSPSPQTVLTDDGGVRAVVTDVSADFFRVGGVEPVLGRALGADENRLGGPPVVVVSHRFWRDELGSPDDLAGVTVSLRGERHDVLGVMPAGFELPDAPDLWAPLDRTRWWTVRGNHVVEVVGRLAPGATVARAGDELQRIHAGIVEASPEVETPGVVVRELKDELTAGSRRPLVLLLGASGFLLLVACTNVASTLLARGSGRAREMGVRASLGAGRARLVRQLLVESLALAGLGAAAAVLVARGALAVTRWLDPGAVPRLQEVGLDGGVLLFTAGAAVLTGVLFGLWPALGMTRHTVAGTVREGRSDSERGTRRAWRLLMVGEVAMAVVLLAGAGLLIRSLSAVLDRDLGYEPAGVVTGRLHLPAGKYATAEEGVAFLDRMLDEVRRSPGVDEAGLALLLPVRGDGNVGGAVLLEGDVPTERWFQYRVADAGLFRTLGVPLLEGRLFDASDGPGAPHAAVVDRAMAEALWPGESALGRRFNPRGMDPYRDEWLTVVGVVGEIRDWSQAQGSSPTYWVHHRQRPAFLGLFGLSVVARGDDAGVVGAALRDRVRELDADIPVRVATLSSRLGGSVADRRFTAFVLAAFALVALLLATAGVYGVVSYTVARRTREMGIRVALGARPGQVRGRIQREALGAVALGAAAGIAGALLLARTLRSLLVDVAPGDPVALLGGVAVLGAAAWLASWVPARRGTRVDPVRALREP